MEIDWHTGDRAELRPLFELAEDSQTQLDQYIGLGRILVARRDGAILGQLQLIPWPQSGEIDAGEIEIKSLGVTPDAQGTGIGRALIDAAVERCVADGWVRLLVSTAAADTGNLRFYQRVGFRMLSIERDAFTPATGYPDPIVIDGIPLRDRVWLSQDLSHDGRSSR
ncbi:MAG TPA: GNAT family N-acetyltransferase [Nocardioidaceae bacterium]|nr:GNAT family N-acetyltransferase [Nocardioidaceae bacterium]